MKKNYVSAESEVITSYILKGIKLPDNFITFRKILSYISDLDIVELQPIVDEIERNLYKKNSLILNMGVVIDLYNINNKKLMDLIDSLLPEVLILIDLLTFKIESTVITATVQMNDTVKQMTNMSEYVKTVEKLTAEATYLAYYRKNLSDLQLCKQYLLELPSLYNSEEKIKLKPLFTEYTDEYLMYILALEQSMNICKDLNVLVTLFTTLGAIQQVVPKDNLHPFKLDECKNLVELLMFPERYLESVKDEDVLSKKVASLFCHTYPTLAANYLDTYLEVADKLDYQKQINLKECFDIHEDLSGISSMLSMR